MVVPELHIFRGKGMTVRPFVAFSQVKGQLGEIRIPFPVVNLLRIDYGLGYSNGEWNKGSLHWGVLHKF